VSYARFRREAGPGKLPRIAKARAARTAADAPPLATALPPVHRGRNLGTPDKESGDPQDASGNEIEAALSRLSKITSSGVKK